LLAGLIVTAAAKEGSMTLNICEMPGRELTGQIVKHYLEFGSVISLKILPSETASDYRFAVVRMSTRTEATNLFNEWGVSTYGDSVTIPLEHYKVRNG